MKTNEQKDTEVKDSNQEPILEEEKKELTLEEKHTQLEQEFQQMKDKWLRTAAEFENFRRRSISEKSNWIKNANERIILEFCDVLDNFQRALDQETEKNHDKGFRKGVELIYKQFNDVLKKEGVTRIDALYKEFDPIYHEALARIPAEQDENVVAAIIQNGYIMNDKVIRPVKVAVSNGEKPVAKKKKEK